MQPYAVIVLCVIGASGVLEIMSGQGWGYLAGVLGGSALTLLALGWRR